MKLSPREIFGKNSDGTQPEFPGVEIRQGFGSDVLKKKKQKWMMKWIQALEKHYVYPPPQKKKRIETLPRCLSQIWSKYPWLFFEQITWICIYLAYKISKSLLSIFQNSFLKLEPNHLSSTFPTSPNIQWAVPNTPAPPKCLGDSGALDGRSTIIDRPFNHGLDLLFHLPWAMHVLKPNRGWNTAGIWKNTKGQTKIWTCNLNSLKKGRSHLQTINFWIQYKFLYVNLNCLDVNVERDMLPSLASKRSLK